jgi:DNA-binding SARP family transcriptional activator/tetratricopeptide (TPR) repeat protein
VRPNIRDGAWLGRLLRSFRHAAGLTQRDLARQAGLSLGAVRDLEQGRTKRPERDTLAALVAAFRLNGVQAGELEQAAAGPALRLQVLGPLVVRLDGSVMPLGGPAQHAVLGMLALSPNSLVRKAGIIDVLWPDNPPTNAVKLIQAHVSRIRKVLAVRDSADHAVVLSSVDACYRLRVGPAQLDLLRFSQLAADARATNARGDHAAACDLYEQAISLWRGDALADVDLLRGYPATVGVNRQRTEIVIEYARAASTAGWHGRVLSLVQELADREPLNEQAHAQMMIALAGSGRQAEALAVYQGLCRRLNDELGMPPGPDLARAHRLVLRQEVPAIEASLTLTNPPPNGCTPRFPLVIPHQIPTPTRLFAGRTEELNALSALLDDAEQTRSAVVISAIGGTAGVGKTALAVHWAHQVAGRFPDGQLYVNLRGFHSSGTPMSPAEAIRGFLDSLGIPAERIPAGPDAQTGLYRSLMSRRRMLVVLDNAQDAEQVRPLLPGNSGCLTLVTSRSQLTGLVVAEGAHLLTLDLLTEAEARELLALRLGEARLSAEPRAAAELIRLCAGLPLALAIAAARASTRPGLGIGALAEELKDAQRRLDALETGDPAVSARTVFSWSLGHLPAPAVRLFRLLGLHLGPDITIPAAASLAGILPSEARGALRDLIGAYLVSERVPGRYSMHDLLRAYATEQANASESEADRLPAVLRMLDHYLHTAWAADRLLRPGRDRIALAPPQPGGMPEEIADRAQAMAWFQGEQQVLLGAARLAHNMGFAEHAWKLPWTLTVFLDCRGDWQQLADVHHMALAAARHCDDKAGQAMAHRDLARAYLRLGQTDGGNHHLEQALLLYQETGDFVGQGRTHLALALVMDTESRYDEAFSHNEQALLLLSRAGDQAGQSNALSSVGWSYAQRGDYITALTFCHEAIRLQRRSGNRYGEAHTLDSIGYVYRRLGQHAQAIGCYEQSVSLFCELGDRYYQADTLVNLGDALHAVGNSQRARDAWHQAVDILDDLHHSRAAQVREMLASSLPMRPS